MPLKLNVGLSKKIGLPDYGSLGASCHVVELDGTLLQQDLDTFQRHVRNAYVACAQAVNELGRHAANPSRAHASANGGEHKAVGNGTNAVNCHAPATMHFMGGSEELRGGRCRRRVRRSASSRIPQGSPG